ncbi:PulJ/GspJ family protein [Lacipirellula limnantheis]|uniref:Prepilin-type N-terminal cleavage/methylation domain-containing protein n=1 Tax=Lacipirellula limnantheis TaxID=2528024 RepID=A0A517U3M2_9BACT|nr:type II secretion system protein [Lacipirellula limnantheis]QDT75221.1 hypothetical protein I41_44310 [Lacipirellula limnantheis]
MNMRSRRAISLIELLAVLSGCSVVLGLTASLLHQTMRAQSHTRDFFDVERNAQRLARQFRSDVHAAAVDSIDVDLADAGDGVLLQMELPDGQSVAYQRAAEKIIRIASQTDGPTAREEYALSESIEIDVRELDAPRRVELSITSSPPQPSQEAPPSPASIRATPVNLKVDAIPARDLRYAAPATSAGEAT